jgi:hypothetical protein
MVRGGILAVTNFDVATPYLLVLRDVLAQRFRTTGDRIKVDLDFADGRMCPRFGIPETVVEASGFSRDLAIAELRRSWGAIRKIVIGAIARASERWCDFP